MNVIKKFIISPPFGTYICHKNATSVLGTYTYTPRSGKWLQVLKTLRYTKRGWVNKIGLKNPGIKSIFFWDLNKIYSISCSGILFNWIMMIEYIPDNIMVELNLSCPNIDQKEINDKLIFHDYCLKFPIVIAKISPLSNINDIDFYYNAGIRYFHISNTLPTERGGLSGRMLQQYNLPLIEQIKKIFNDVVIIGGGGIYTQADLQRYTDAGADHYSLATVWFTPWKASKLIKSLPE